MPTRKRIAVVGGGVAGITAAYLLSPSHDVTLFEAAPRLGGHAHSIAVEPGIELDTAFLVFNSGSYPKFLKFLSCLGVTDKVRDTDMSMSFSNRDANLEYAVNDGLRALFSQTANVLKPSFWKLLGEIKRFRENANGFLEGNDQDTTLADYAHRHSHSRAFAENFLYPLGASVWSMPTDSMEHFPAELFFRFFAHHKALKREQGAKWQTLAGGSIGYVRAFQKQFTGSLRLATPVHRVTRRANEVVVCGAQGNLGEFDDIVVATHADLALRLLDSPTPEEQALLGSWCYQSNPTTLHTDASVMPRHKSAWASWNIAYGKEARTGHQNYGVTYWLNRIQRPETEQPYFVSFGAVKVESNKVRARMDYRHPIFDSNSLASQPTLARLASDRTHFCGSYFGNGFHEAAIESAERVARRLGVGGLP